MKKPNKISPLLVRAGVTKRTKGRLSLGNHSFACQMGVCGSTTRKREGDGATPLGNFAVLSVYYRADRLARPKTILPTTIIRAKDGWCDEPTDRNYNRPVLLPYSASAESLWRTDRAYDLIVVLDYNFSQRSMHRGSAIFMHLAHDDMRPTAGCLAFSERDLRLILRRLKPGDRIFIR